MYVDVSKDVFVILAQELINNLAELKPPKGSFIGAAVLFGVFTIISLIRFFVYQQELIQYLLSHHIDQQKDLLTFLDYRPEYSNSFRGLKFLYDKDYLRFLFGEDYLDDPELLRLKVLVRKSFINMTGGTLTTCLTIFLMVCLYHN